VTRCRSLFDLDIFLCCGHNSHVVSLQRKTMQQAATLKERFKAINPQDPCPPTEKP
jgi:hypothetical protein